MESWDRLLEELTARLVAVAGGRGAMAGLQSPGWAAQLQADRRALTVRIRFSGPSAASPRLDDYQLVLIYAAGYEPGTGYPPLSFTRGMKLREGFQWDEQSLREVVLELLGLFRHVLKVDATELSLAASEPRTGALPPPRRFRRSAR